MFVSGSVGRKRKRKHIARTKAPARSARPTVAQMQAQSMSMQRAEQAHAIEELETTLTSLHLQEFAAAEPRLIAIPYAPSPRSVARDLYRAAVVNVAPWSSSTQIRSGKP